MEFLMKPKMEKDCCFIDIESIRTSFGRWGNKGNRNMTIE